MKIFVDYKKLSTMKKISLWGSIASIIGLALYFLPITGTSQYHTKQRSGDDELIVAQKPSQSTLGAQSPNIMGEQVKVNIHYVNDSVEEDLPSKKNSFPTTNAEKKVVNEVLSYLQIQLTLLNGVYELFSKGLTKADEYNRYPTSSGYQALSKKIKFEQNEMHDLLEQNHQLSQLLQEKLSDTPLSVADLAVLYDIVNIDARELSERLDLLLVLLNPDNPFNKITKDKWLSITREAHRQGVLILTYAVCEFLLPINPRALRDFRKEFLPELTAFESDGFDFSLDKTQLQQLQIAAERKRNALGDELSMLVGDMNVTLQVGESMLQQKREELQRLIDKKRNQK